MTIVRVDDQAWQDVLNIYEFIAHKGTPMSAARVAEKILASTDCLMMFPESGRIRYDIDPSARTVGWGPYLIFYRITRDRRFVDVVRVIDGRRDLPAAFWDVSYLIAA